MSYVDTIVVTPITNSSSFSSTTDVPCNKTSLPAEEQSEALNTAILPWYGFCCSSSAVFHAPMGILISHPVPQQVSLFTAEIC